MSNSKPISPPFFADELGGGVRNDFNLEFMSVLDAV